MVKGVGKLHDQKGQLNNIKKIGYETKEIFREGAVKVAAGGEVIRNAGRENEQIAGKLDEGNRTITRIAKREFVYKLLLNFLILALFAAFVAVLIVKLTRKKS